MSPSSDNKSPKGDSQENNLDVVQFSARLNSRMDEIGIKQSKLSEITGIHRSLISAYCLAKKTPNAVGAIKISNALRLNCEYLILGTGEKELEIILGRRTYVVAEKTSVANKNLLREMKPASWRVALPIVDLTIQSGFAWELDQIIEDYFIDSRILKDLGRENINGLCAGVILNDSLADAIPQGSMLIIDINDKVIREGVFVFKFGDYLYTKRLRPYGKNGVAILSENPKYQPEIVDNAKELIILGRVLKAIISV